MNTVSIRANGKRVLLLGATGRMGRCVAPLLAMLPDVQLGLGGRSLGILEDLAKPLGALAVQIADLRDERGLATLFADWDVVINAAGPEQEVVLPVLRAAIASGTHYGDIAAETSVARDSLELSDLAKSAGISALCGIGTMPAATCLLAKYAIGQFETVDDVLIGMTYPTPDAQTCATYAEQFSQGNGSATWKTMLFAPIDGAVIKQAGSVRPVIGTWENRREIHYPNGPKLPGLISNFPEVLLIDRRYPEIPNVAVAVGLDSTCAADAWRTALSDIAKGRSRDYAAEEFMRTMAGDDQKDLALVTLGKIAMVNVTGTRKGVPGRLAVRTSEWIPTENLMVAMTEWLLSSARRPGVFVAEDLFDPLTFFERSYELTGRMRPECGLIVEEFQQLR